MGLGEFDRCEICGEWGWLRSHKCPPKWKVVCFEALAFPETLHDEWETIHASDASGAAEKYMARADRAIAEFTEYDVVVVQAWDGDEQKFFSVRGELVPEYTACPLASLDAAKEEYKTNEGRLPGIFAEDGEDGPEWPDEPSGNLAHVNVTPVRLT